MHPERSLDNADEGGAGLLIALMAAGLIPVVAAWNDGAAIEGAASAGFLVALLAFVLLIASLRAEPRKVAPDSRVPQPAKVLPFISMQKVKLTCSHCEREDIRLAASVKKGQTVRCPHCKKSYRIEAMTFLVGSAG